MTNLVLHSTKKKCGDLFLNHLAEVQQMEHCRHIGVSLISAELRTVPTLGKTGVVRVANYATCGNINIEKIGIRALSLYNNLYKENSSGPPRTGSSRTGLPAGSAPSPYLPSNVPSFQRWRQYLSV